MFSSSRALSRSPSLELNRPCAQRWPGQIPSTSPHFLAWSPSLDLFHSRMERRMSDYAAAQPSGRYGASSFGLAFDLSGLDHFSAYSQCIVGDALAMTRTLAM